MIKTRCNIRLEWTPYLIRDWQWDTNTVQAEADVDTNTGQAEAGVDTNIAQAEAAKDTNTGQAEAGVEAVYGQQMGAIEVLETLLRPLMTSGGQAQPS